MKYKNNFLIALFVLISFSLFSCDDQDSNPVVPNPPLTGTNWSLKEINFSYSGTLIDNAGWKSFIINSGLVNFLGTMNMQLSDSGFNMTAQVNETYSSFFPMGLSGICWGTLRIENNLLLLHTQNANGVFEPGRASQEAYATYFFENGKLVLYVVIPTYMKIANYPGYLRVGEEYYSCKFVAG